MPYSLTRPWFHRRGMPSYSVQPPRHEAMLASHGSGRPVLPAGAVRQRRRGPCNQGGSPRRPRRGERPCYPSPLAPLRLRKSEQCEWPPNHARFGFLLESKPGPQIRVCRLTHCLGSSTPESARGMPAAARGTSGTPLEIRGRKRPVHPSYRFKQGRKP